MHNISGRKRVIPCSYALALFLSGSAVREQRFSSRRAISESRSQAVGIEIKSDSLTGLNSKPAAAAAAATALE